MTEQQFIDTIREAQARGKSELAAILNGIFRGVKRAVLRNLDGHINGNPHDIWIESASGKKVIGRAYLGSPQRAANLEGWHNRIKNFA